MVRGTKLSDLSLRYILLGLVLIFSLAFILVSGSAAGDTTYSEKITVVTDDNYPPFSFRDSEGGLQGIIIDQWKLWEDKTGIEVEISGMAWAEAQREFEAGIYDVLETPMYTEERAVKYDFTEPYTTIDTAIYFNNKISGISDVESLKGFVVAVKSGDVSHQYLIDQGITQFSEYDNYEDIVIAAKEGDVVIFVMDSPQAEYFLYKYGIQKDFSSTSPLYSGEIHRAVLKGNTELVSKIDEGFNKITGSEYRDIDKKWYGISTASNEDLQYFLLAVILSLLCILLLLVWNYTLKRKVDEKTSELKNEVESGKKQAAELQQSEKRFREIFDNIYDGVALVSSEGENRGRILSVNKAASDMLGYSKEELVNMDPALLHSPARKGDVLRVSEALAKSERAVIETEYMRKDGSVFPVESSINRFVLGDKMVTLVVSRDISERKNVLKRLEESERRYRGVVEDQTELICRFRYDGTINFVNDAFCRYFEMERESLEGGKLDLELLSEDTDDLRKKLRALTPEEPVISVLNKISMADGKIRWQSWTHRAIFDENREFIEYQSVGRDFTEQMRKDETLAFAAKKLNVLNHVTFAEIQNYLFCEQGYLQLAMDLATDEKQKEFLENQAVTMDKIAETLRFAKNYQDLGISPPEWHEFEKIFVFAISHTNTSNMEKNFDISGVLIFSDNLLEKALSVLVSRILAYDLNIGKISLGYEIEDEMLRIILEMDGKGISRESAENIFTRGGDPETGINLFLTEEVLSVTNITIKECGSPEKGFRFEILVPPNAFRIRED